MRSNKEKRACDRVEELKSGDDCLTQVRIDELLIKPTNLLVCLPELGSLVDINLASLLRVGLSEFHALPGALYLLLEDSPLGGEIRSARKAENGSQLNLGGVKEVAVRIV